MRTPFGEPSGALTFGMLAGSEVVFLARHGYGHTIAPHEINYRANLWALKDLNIEGIFALASVGGIRDDLGPGTLVVPDQIIDYTHSRKSTFFEGSGTPVTHVDFTQPYSGKLRSRLLQAARGIGEALVDGAVYGCTQGPRLETAAEINRLHADGADLVGMTGMPEAALARELELDYACLAVVVNHAAGRGTSVQRIAMGELEEVLGETMVRAVRILEASLGSLA
jgi:5'-methylthioadenosine phosphorylase